MGLYFKGSYLTQINDFSRATKTSNITITITIEFKRMI